MRRIASVSGRKGGSELAYQRGRPREVPRGPGSDRDSGPDAPLRFDDLVRSLGDDWHERGTSRTNRGELTIFEHVNDDTSRLVVKRCPTWTADEVRRLAATMSTCRSHAAARDLRPHVPHLESWGIDPPYLCTAWVDGSSVDEWMAMELADLPARDAVERTIDLAIGMGELMAWFHRAMEAEVETIAGRRDAARSASGMITGALAGKGAHGFRTRVYSIEDPGPHNTIRDEAGHLWLIDLPAEARTVTVEQDIARLASRVVGAIHRHSNARWVPYRPTVDAVIDGYRRGSTREDDVDRTLVFACLSSDAAIKAALTRRRLPPGTRLECLVRESAGAVTLGGAALRERLRGGRRGRQEKRAPDR